MSPMLDQAPCGPAVPCLSRQARAAVMVRLRGEADAGHRSAVSGHRSPVKQVIGRQCHSSVSVIRVNTGMVNFRKFLLPASEQGCHISRNISGNLHLPQAGRTWWVAGPIGTAFRQALILSARADIER